MKKYIITTYNPLCEINKKFLKCLQNYCHLNKAELLFIPTNINKLNEQDLINQSILKQSKYLNKNIMISLLPIDAEQADPLTGLDRLSSNHLSMIYASPKQRLKSIASPSEDLPRVLMTTGAITKPIKNKTKKALISNIDHIFGAIVIEIVTPTIYHFRQIQADKNGEFIDLGIQYGESKTTKVKLEALIPGDYHCGFTDPKVKKIIINILNKYKPKHLILHDFFDGISINRFIDNKRLTKAQLGNLNDLTSELLFASNELKQLSNNVENIIIVKSNHDEFLNIWLNEGKYIFDTRNHIIGLELALAQAQGKDPLEYGLNKFQKYNNVKFLKTDESFKITKTKIEVGVHGHKGANGSRGNSSNLEKCYQNIIMGHSHTPEILRQAWVVGTSTYLRLNYNEGPSSWMQTLCLVYYNGQRQLINIIKGNASI